jgi:hypothetical protein
MRQILTGTLQLLLLVRIPMEESIVDHKVVSQRAPMGEYVKSSFGDLQRDNINAQWMVARSWLLTEMGKELLDICMYVVWQEDLIYVSYSVTFSAIRTPMVYILPAPSLALLNYSPSNTTIHDWRKI